MELVLFIAFVNLIGVVFKSRNNKSKKQLDQLNALKLKMELLKLEQSLQEKGIDLSSANLGNEPELSLANSSSCSPIFNLLFKLGLGFVAFAFILFTICFIIG